MTTPTPKPKGNPLTKRVGPLPAYAWLGVIVLAYFAYAHFKSSAASAAAAAPITSGTPAMFSPQTTDPTGGGGGTSIPQLPMPTSTTMLDPTGGTVPATPATTSTADAAAVDQGGAPGGLAQDGTASSPFPTTDNSSPQGWAATLAGGQTNGSLPPEFQVPGLPPNAYVIGGPSTSISATPAPQLTDPQAPDALARVVTSGANVFTPSSPDVRQVYAVPAPAAAPTIHPDYQAPQPTIMIGVGGSKAAN